MTDPLSGTLAGTLTTQDGRVFTLGGAIELVPVADEPSPATVTVNVYDVEQPNADDPMGHASAVAIRTPRVPGLIWFSKNGILGNPVSLDAHSGDPVMLFDLTPGPHVFRAIFQPSHDAYATVTSDPVEVLTLQAEGDPCPCDCDDCGPIAQDPGDQT